MMRDACESTAEHGANEEAGCDHSARGDGEGEREHLGDQKDQQKIERELTIDGELYLAMTAPKTLGSLRVTRPTTSRPTKA